MISELEELRSHRSYCAQKMKMVMEDQLLGILSKDEARAQYDRYSAELLDTDARIHALQSPECVEVTAVGDSERSYVVAGPPLSGLPPGSWHCPESVAPPLTADLYPHNGAGYYHGNYSLQPHKHLDEYSGVNYPSVYGYFSHDIPASAPSFVYTGPKPREIVDELFTEVTGLNPEDTYDGWREAYISTGLVSALEHMKGHVR